MVVVGVHPDGPEGPPAWATALVDLVVADPGPVVATVEAAPLAAATLALVLRASLALDVPSGLAAESAAYSTLQSGPEFARWLADGRASASEGRPRPRKAGTVPAKRGVEPGEAGAAPPGGHPIGAAVVSRVVPASAPCSSSGGRPSCGSRWLARSGTTR